jgi:hypothetical protein
MTIAQFPNKPLIIALLAALLSLVTRGQAHSFVSAIFYIALTIWAYEELVRGVNWFRRLLGAVVLIYIFVQLGLQLAR